MTTVDVHEAKTRLSQLIAEAEAGGEVVIARNGKPVARLEIGDAFFEPLPEPEIAAWE